MTRQLELHAPRAMSLLLLPTHLPGRGQRQASSHRAGLRDRLSAGPDSLHVNILPEIRGEKQRKSMNIQ